MGGKATAEKERLRLLATLPFEPEVVKEGDTGVIALLDNNDLVITREFNIMVDKIAELTDGLLTLNPPSAKKTA